MVTGVKASWLCVYLYQMGCSKSSAGIEILSPIWQHGMNKFERLQKSQAQAYAAEAPYLLVTFLQLVVLDFCHNRMLMTDDSPLQLIHQSSRVQGYLGPFY